MDIPAAGGIVFDGGNRLLLVRRARPPEVGRWTIPGGKCNPGERPDHACIREVFEETGMIVEVERFAGRVHRIAPSGDRFVIDDFVCRVVGGTLAAGDDAADAGWFSSSELIDVALVNGLLEALREWKLLP